MISALLALAALCLGRWSARIFHHLAQSLIPVAACGVFLGLSSLTVTMLRAEGVDLGAAVAWLRAALIIGAALWSLAFAWAIAGAYSHARARRLAAIAPIAAATAIGSLTTAQLFWPLIVM
jgi:hypothetical protein